MEAVLEFFIPPVVVGIDDVVLLVFKRMLCIRLCNHAFIDLFTITDADLLEPDLIAAHRLRQIHNLKRGYFGNVRLTANTFLERFDNELNSFVKADPEPCHAEVRDGKFLGPLFQLRPEKGNHRASAACNIAVTHDGKRG